MTQSLSKIDFIRYFKMIKIFSVEMRQILPILFLLVPVWGTYLISFIYPLTAIFVSRNMLFVRSKNKKKNKIIWQGF